MAPNKTPIQPHRSLPPEIISAVIAYCDRDLADDDHYHRMFDFVSTDALRDQIVVEIQSARYIYKLMSGLGVSGPRLQAHLKFQITQFASVYESVICHFLWSIYAEHPEVLKISFHTTFKKVADWPKGLEVSKEDEPLSLCADRSQKTQPQSIKFDDKVNAAVAIGLVQMAVGEEIKGFYKLRNSIHIESALKNDIAFEVAQARAAYARMMPFTIHLRKHLRKQLKSTP